ncbi:MAG: CAP domain-containing protein [Planctomycetota bacterium]
MRDRILSAAVVLVLGLSAPALADKIVLVSGGKVEGTIVKETRKAVQIRKKSGILVTVPRDEIDRIEKTDWKKLLGEKEQKLAKDDHDGRYALAVWCTDHALDEDAVRLCEAVIAQAKDHHDARKFLGYAQVDGKWLRGDELKKAQGLVQYKGKWVTPEERALREAEEDARDRPPPAPKPSKQPKATPDEPEAKQVARPALPEEDEALLKAVRGSGPAARREEAAKALAARGGDAQQALRAALSEALEKAQKKLVAYFERGKAKVRTKLAKRIVGLRKEALAIIFDKGIYPDQDHGAVGQPKVDAAVNRLVRAYDDPLHELADDDEVKDLLSEVERLAAWARDYGGEGAPAANEGALAEEVAKAVDMRRCPVDAEDAKVIGKSQEVMALNEKRKGSCSDEELACVRATNEYRMLFGMRALRLHEPLVRAARGHSKDMNRLRFFDHSSPVPGKRGPGDRCKAEGASYSGENIAMGMTSGVQAFRAWYTSSGHHRNILTKGHISIGVGVDGNYWTQDFGYDNPK